MERYSILNNLDKCYFCGMPAQCIHEVFFGTANRKVSIKNGFCVGLCHNHHNMSNDGVHNNRQNDITLKQRYQKEYEKSYNREDFIKLIGKSYL